MKINSSFSTFEKGLPLTIGKIKQAIPQKPLSYDMRCLKPEPALHDKKMTFFIVSFSDRQGITITGFLHNTK